MRKEVILSDTILLKRDIRSVWHALNNYSSWHRWFSTPKGEQFQCCHLLVDNNGVGDIVRCFLCNGSFLDYEIVEKVPNRMLKARLLHPRRGSDPSGNFHEFALETKGEGTAIISITSFPLQGGSLFLFPVAKIRSRRASRERLSSFEKAATADRQETRHPL